MSLQVAVDVEAPMEALKARLKTVPGVVTVTRVWQPWEQLSNLAQPAIVIVEPKEKQTARRGQQPSLTLEVRLVVYVRVDNQDPANEPNTVLNILIKGIRTALLPSGSGVASNVQDLGGLVSNCVIEGEIIKDAGILDEQASALVPVVITLP